MIIACLGALNSQEAKQQKATEIAGRLLKELANEQLGSHHKEQSLNNDENVQPKIEKIESHFSTESDDADDEDVEFIPLIDDLYEMYANKYDQEPDDEESSSELVDNEYLLPINRQQLLRYFAEEENSDENLTPVIHSPVVDDTQMKAENHRRKRHLVY
ncbi:unnamed protein product [Rotaria sp. Silwood1]|nr:unnamed protein product [Rotaria sp. Silwood1]CAF0861222.1 unnamed protein product [Rotaria sp. Silwood1]CAF3380241.1 unnamed protein product [Rotaria sp. Silwood1]CAF3387428.1 unnamed protein product [Rotaria sp. Silwood1]CAF4535859.1 unnamed protein product [Rotaria sp. Silwood1]